MKEKISIANTEVTAARLNHENLLSRHTEIIGAVEQALTDEATAKEVLTTTEKLYISGSATLEQVESARLSTLTATERVKHLEGLAAKIERDTATAARTLQTLQGKLASTVTSAAAQMLRKKIEDFTAANIDELQHFAALATIAGMDHHHGIAAPPMRNDDLMLLVREIKAELVA